MFRNGAEDPDSKQRCLGTASYNSDPWFLSSMWVAAGAQIIQGYVTDKSHCNDCHENKLQLSRACI